jgi:hypothetical protein
MNRSFPTNSENGVYDNSRWRFPEATDGVVPRSSRWAQLSSLSDRGGLVFSVLRMSHSGHSRLSRPVMPLSRCPLPSESDRRRRLRRNDAKRHKPTSRLNVRIRLGRRHSSVRPALGVYVAGTPRRKVIGTCLGAARLVCMTEVSDLPDPVKMPAASRDAMLRRNVVVRASGKSHSALDQRTLPLELVQIAGVPNDKKNERLRPCLI